MIEDRATKQSSLPALADDYPFTSWPEIGRRLETPAGMAGIGNPILTTGVCHHSLEFVYLHPDRLHLRFGTWRRSQ